MALHSKTLEGGVMYEKSAETCGKRNRTSANAQEWLKP